MPSALLPVARAIFALYFDIGQGTALIVLLISLIVSIGGDLIIATTPAQNWPLRMSLAALAAIAANVASIVLIAVAS